MKTIKRETFNFGKALDLLEKGKLVARQGWNGINMFVFRRPPDTLKESVVIDNVKSLPSDYKEWVKHHPTESGEITFSGYFCLKAANGTVVNGWLASQTDMQADDWYEVHPHS